jgi:hypothetical protein
VPDLADLAERIYLDEYLADLIADVLDIHTAAIEEVCKAVKTLWDEVAELRDIVHDLSTRIEGQ